MSQFFITDPTLEAYWRSIILFGRNVASYKFALGKALLEFAAKGQDFVPLDVLARPYAYHLIEHQKHAPKQGTFAKSQFLNTCADFANERIPEDELILATVRLGFNNVIDAFHTVGTDSLPKRFYHDDRKSRGGITIDDNLMLLTQSMQSSNFAHEIESRWRLVETAWDLQVAAHMLSVKYDAQDSELYIVDDKRRRRTITSCRGALNGYQKGKCFYCFREMLISPEYYGETDVDHFLPWMLMQSLPFQTVNLNGVWNLVLSCVECNRGRDGKFDRIPGLTLLGRLERRNNYLIDSHHPLRETLIQQTGKDEAARRGFLKDMYQRAVNARIMTWQPHEQGNEVF